MKTILLVLAGSAVLVCAGCGGRAAGRPIAEPDRLPALAAAPDDDPAEPAVRLDRGAPESAARPSSDVRRSSLTHVLQPGQTLYSIARAYAVPVEALMRINGIRDPTAIRAGTPIVIPAPGAPQAGGRVAEASILPAPFPAPPGSRPPFSEPPAPSPPPEASPPSPGRATAPGPALSWPLRGAITARFGRRSRHRHHEGIDIDGVVGEDVLAAAAGTVVRAGREGGYGRLVVLDHGAGITTLYAHASRLLVRAGDRVERGEPIAEVGRSGNARGSHLHFEVREDGRAVDPLRILRAASARGAFEAR